jgi:hypothetical protein
MLGVYQVGFQSRLTYFYFKAAYILNSRIYSSIIRTLLSLPTSEVYFRQVFLQLLLMDKVYLLKYQYYSISYFKVYFTK